MTVDDLRRLERVHVRAWPALETARIQGWLWRHSGGGSQRANSVSAIDFEGGSPEAALDEVEARYREKGAPARLHSFSAGRPAKLPEILGARGYRQGEQTLTMAKAVAKPVPVDGEPSTLAAADWLEVYLEAITENRRKVNSMILAAVPEPRAFFAFREGRRVISTALCVAEPEGADGSFAVIECVATREHARRRGGARAVLAAVEHWACRREIRLLGLQVSEANTAAIALYASLGFAAVDRNRFWVRD